jgi:hypothetical protein
VASTVLVLTISSVIYCVVPPELVDDLYDKLVAHYEKNPDVTVIVDRRRGPDRRNRNGHVRYDERRTMRDGPDRLNGNGQVWYDERRMTRDRRRTRATGTFPTVEVTTPGW